MKRGELIAGRYELIRRLGHGGMGEVWAGRDHTLHRDIALKTLLVDGATFADLPLRFEREAVAAAQINHPNVAALYDRGVHEDVLFLVMEKVDGGTLAELLSEQGTLAPAQALDIAEAICVALMAAHQARVIHYDIKPHNVMLTRDGRVKVVDFGIAGLSRTTFTLARSSQLAPAGTPEYGAPEQFHTERGDERSDLYALGGVLFAMLAGRPPFVGHNALAIIRHKIDEDAPQLDSLRPGLPRPLTALVADLLERDPSRRPQSAREVHDRLCDLRVTLSAPTYPPAPAWPGHTNKLHRPHPPVGPSRDAADRSRRRALGPTGAAARGPESVAGPQVRAQSRPRPDDDHRRNEPPVYSPKGFGHEGPSTGDHKRLKISVAVLVALGLLGGAGLFGYQWTQDQYYIGEEGDHIAVYQGINQNLAGLSLSSVHTSYRDVELRYLPHDQRAHVNKTVSVSSLTEALETVTELQNWAKLCQKVAGIGTSETSQAPGLSEDDLSRASACPILDGPSR
ncbi:serine/threonine-protein kinase [Kitasatospora sp. NPDC093550]|uniref:serine/threonine-protein kinase n=1 Tax=Kitasatospora sp. NPDC093550 TaxID=3364089 RepID=UPI003802DF02